ncbi:hypothetical protein C7H19_23770 [Aphanothece hegewaldii CCALA 016]|uniref:Uncharacterized protein n=1 Tax=Aphanothece hegewaldii CCALA 016 TaxID=2107694 RepID=A0A2T1LRB9_9CHRO|nr:hypothetical protein [Aphanothece hegewaldii]PSF30533.1 hypothetical protein C7H19_23770 [Aphanothece hegewaldii CCALA 016]
MPNPFVSVLIAQLGGYCRLRTFIGAYAFVQSEQILSFKFKSSKHFNCCSISLNDSDLYDIILYKLVKKDGLIQEMENATVEVKNVYCDQLVPTFTEHTGLFLFFTKEQEQAHLTRFG